MMSFGFLASYAGTIFAVSIMNDSVELLHRRSLARLCVFPGVDQVCPGGGPEESRGTDFLCEVFVGVSITGILKEISLTLYGHTNENVIEMKMSECMRPYV